MSEMLRKFGVEEVYDYETLCKDCGVRYGSHAGATCPRDVPNLPRTEPLTLSRPTEMASLTQIKAKLEQSLNAEMNLALGINKLGEKLDAIAESQGKLLEAISGLRESGMRNHQQIRHELAVVRLCRKRKKGPR